MRTEEEYLKLENELLKKEIEILKLRQKEKEYLFKFIPGLTPINSPGVTPDIGTSTVPYAPGDYFRSTYSYYDPFRTIWGGSVSNG